jgi:hypothetical protein
MDLLARRVTRQGQVIELQPREFRLLEVLMQAEGHHRLAEVGLRVAGRMRQRHEHLLATLLPLAHVILDDRVAAGEPALVSKPVEHLLGRVALPARHLSVLVQPSINGRDERIQLGQSDRD